MNYSGDIDDLVCFQVGPVDHIFHSVDLPVNVPYRAVENVTEGDNVAPFNM